ncbi:hypothetical protein N7V09_14215 [Shewanella seohaensis]|uniref:hypothetical protein n=1 Tax=Shewanella seohaensis TaxID=755175 RepID=UPI00200CE2AE|nr:hypothetical protein [Shewanella seohaensis]MCL1122016.1 hypothetical protein [Shewanella seohaensis]UXM81002.1 hypothetical protein N7V09_14215 [Shewanella seohaensis]
MNLDVLGFLIENESYIEDMAESANIDSSISIGIAKLLYVNGGNLSILKGKQTYHYERVIRPLLENVQCEGPIGMMDDEDGNWVSSCVNGGIIDDESLYQSYLEEDFKCQICRYDQERM